MESREGEKDFKEYLESKEKKTCESVSLKSDKISLNFKEITSIGKNIPYQYKFKTKLYLSYNHLSSLDGLSFFENITHLSISFNDILNIEELQNVHFPEKILSLSVKGNFFEKHPNYKALIIRYFPK